MLEPTYQELYGWNNSVENANYVNPDRKPDEYPKEEAEAIWSNPKRDDEYANDYVPLTAEELAVHKERREKIAKGEIPFEELSFGEKFFYIDTLERNQYLDIGEL